MGTPTHNMEQRNHHTDGDWINRRWQGEGDVQAPKEVVKIDKEKQERIAAHKSQQDVDGNCGRHCQHPQCGQFDYMPTLCGCCGKFYCHEHAEFASHGCKREVLLGDKRATTCPCCSQAIHVNIEAGESVDTAVNRHIESGCKSGLAEKIKKQRDAMNRCSYGKGKGRCKDCGLVRFDCGDCGKKFCLKHRHAADHKCTGKAARPEPVVKSNPLSSFIMGMA